MNKMSALVLTFVCAVGMVGVEAGQADEGGLKNSVFKRLKKGQVVSLSDNGSTYSIRVYPDTPIGHRIIDLGADYLVVEDPAGAFTEYIPVTSIKAISFLRMPLGEGK